MINSALSIAAAKINDDERLSRKQKESRLTKLFAKKGIKLVFTGKEDSRYAEKEASEKEAEDN